MAMILRQMEGMVYMLVKLTKLSLVISRNLEKWARVST